MKAYFKAVLARLALAGVFVISAGALWLGEIVIAAELNVTRTTVFVAMLIFALMSGTIAAIRENRKKKRAAEIIPVLLNEAITVQKKMLEEIDAEPARAGKTRQRAMCKIMLVALEEKRDRMTAGKDGRPRRGS